VPAKKARHHRWRRGGVRWSNKETKGRTRNVPSFNFEKGARTERGAIGKKIYGSETSRGGLGWGGGEKMTAGQSRKDVRRQGEIDNGSGHRQIKETIVRSGGRHKGRDSKKEKGYRDGNRW